MLSKCVLALLKVTLLKIDVPFLFLFTGIRNVAFFFSAISAQGRKKSRGKKGANIEDEESDDSNDDILTSSQVASTTSHDWISNYPTVINEKLCPSLNYWIALTTPNGAPANPVTIHRALLEGDVETMANQVHKMFNVTSSMLCFHFFTTPLHDLKLKHFTVFLVLLWVLIVYCWMRFRNEINQCCAGRSRVLRNKKISQSGQSVFYQRKPSHRNQMRYKSSWSKILLLNWKAKL